MASTDNAPIPKSKHHINITNVILDSFLACLLLLLVVSCGIVIRSFLIRRRVRAMVREALEAGFEVDEHGNVLRERPKPKPLGEKPVMWEVWLDEKGNVANSQDTKLSKDQYSDYWDEEKRLEGPWQGILPVSVKVVQPPVSKSLYSTPNPSAISHPPQAHAHPTSRDRGYSPPPVAPAPPTPDKLEVSVLISMPNPNRRFTHGRENSNYAISTKGKEKGDLDEDSEVPDLLFGVTEVGIRP